MALELSEMQRQGITKSIEDLKLFSGRAHHSLAEDIATHLGISLGIMQIKNFSDGEIYVRIQESIRGDDVFIVQSLCDPVNRNLVELLIMLDAFKRASAKTITAVIPYYAYARQDRKTSGREAISAKLVADLIATAGATRVLAVDLHTGQLQGFFSTLVDHVQVEPVLINYISGKGYDPNELVIVSPDAGGVERARKVAKQLVCPIAIVDKRRQAHNLAEVENLIGDVKGKTAILVDDMIDTAGTICEASNLLIKEGAKEVFVCAAHAVFSGPALERLEKSVIKEVIVSNTIPLKPNACSKIVQLNAAPLLGDAIKRIYSNRSVTDLLENYRG
ncbi:MAG TPA: ribose-phosphate pyrophosphokinase [Candidatus Gastranaerophilales bacterium]|nr:ribose-phosphate pyrophosphokinase [Candidatus Gastranaerophilales bacterium]